MRNDAVFSAMSFAIAGLQVSFGVDGGLLKIRVNPADNLKPAILSLSKLSAESSAIELAIAQAQLSTQSTKLSSSNPVSNPTDQSINAKLQEKLVNLESTVRLLEQKLLLKSQSRRDLKKSSSSEGRFGASGSRSNLGILPSVAIRENQEVQYAEIIQEQVEQNAKLQLLNDLLQEKILEKESICLEVEKRLMEREELIRELADKLIIANIEKEDIFNEYEKILQNNVFHRMEESPSKQYEQPIQGQSPKHETHTLEINAVEPEQTEQTEVSETGQPAKVEEKQKDGQVSCG